MENRYRANRREVTLRVDPTVVAVRFAEDLPPSARTAALGGVTLPYSERKHLPGERYSILPLRLPPRAARSARPAESSLSDVALEAAEEAERQVERWIEELQATPGVVRAAPVFKVDLNRAVATDRVVVGFKPKAADPVAMLAELGLEVVEPSTNGEFLVRLPPSEDPFVVARRLWDYEDVEYAEPDFVVTVAPLPPGEPAPPAVPGAGLSSRQYALTLTGADQALKIQPGRPEVCIAVIDGGIDTEHLDLRSATAQEIDARTGDLFQEAHPLDGHGTACAGMALARSPDGTGACGVASGCSLIAVQIGRGTSRDPHDSVADEHAAARGIDEAWKNGADVISFSWVFPISTHITNAIQRAREKGRGGKGCIVLAPVGNDADVVHFPACLDDVVAVAASNRCDFPKTPTSCDGEKHWGSCSGPQVDIAAPGVSNFTTDVRGQGGFNPSPSPDGDYIENFNGTSSATPLVAGAAALVLSVHQGFDEKTVREILRDSAKKVDTVEFDTRGHNEQMGHGRLDVLEAVLLARRLAGVNGPGGGNQPLASGVGASRRRRKPARR